MRRQPPVVHIVKDKEILDRVQNEINTSIALQNSMSDDIEELRKKKKEAERDTELALKNAKKSVVWEAEEVARHKWAVAEAEKASEKAEGTLAGLIEDVSGLQREVQEKQIELKMWSSVVAEDKKKHKIEKDKHERLLAEAKYDLSSTSKQVESARKVFVELTKKVDTLTSEAKNLEAEYLRRSDELQETISVARATIVDLQEKAVTARAEAQVEQDKVANSKKELETVNGEIQAARDRIFAEKSELESKTRFYRSLSKETEEKIKVLEAIILQAQTDKYLADKLKHITNG